MPFLRLPLSILVAAVPEVIDLEWVTAATTLADDRVSVSARVEAASVLMDARNERAIPMLRAAVRGREDNVRKGVIEQLPQWPHPDIVALLREAVYDNQASIPARDLAIAGLGRIDMPAAGRALWQAAGERSLPSSQRRSALEQLRTHYPEILAEKGPPTRSSDLLGGVAGVAGNGVTGAILMSSVGVWGRTDTGVVVGAVGGSVIGAGTAVTYAGFKPVDRGQGLLYASNVGWGLTSGILLSHATFGRTQGVSTSDTKDNINALYRSAGVATGAGIALSRFHHHPTAEDVLSLDVGG